MVLIISKGYMMSKVRERIYMTKEALEAMEIDILNRRHVERYAMVRQWCKGRVIDVACGCGYGTYLLSKNPDVELIVGYDQSEEAITHAKREFKNRNLIFETKSISSVQFRADVLISLETVEHLKNPEILHDMAVRCEVKEIYISYPSKKTTHYNPHHFHDFNDKSLLKVFKEFELSEAIDLHREVRILKLTRIGF